jgi:hypothetical protein
MRKQNVNFVYSEAASVFHYACAEGGSNETGEPNAQQ